MLLHAAAGRKMRPIRLELLPFLLFLLPRMPILILALVGLSFVISLLSTAAVKRIAPVFAFVDKPGHRKIHHIPKPLGGGVAIFIGITLPMLCGLLYVTLFNPPS